MGRHGKFHTARILKIIVGSMEVLLFFLTLLPGSLGEYFWVPPVYLQKWWNVPVKSIDLLHDFLESNTTFLYEVPTDRGDINNHPDLTAETILVTFNQSSYRNFADKKLYMRYNHEHHYAENLVRDTNYRFFFIFTPLLRGPYGLEPHFGIDTFSAVYAPLMGKRVAVIGWTSLYPDDTQAPYGYSVEMVREMHKVIKATNFTFPVLEFDAVHASWSGDVLTSLFNVTEFVIFFAKEESLEVAALINKGELYRIVRLCGLHRTYLRLHDTLREFIVPPPPTKRKKRWRPQSNSVVGNKLHFALILLIGTICLSHKVRLLNGTAASNYKTKNRNVEQVMTPAITVPSQTFHLKI